jgi:hypothetical protein
MTDENLIFLTALFVCVCVLLAAAILIMAITPP